MTVDRMELLRWIHSRYMTTFKNKDKPETYVDGYLDALEDLVALVNGVACNMEMPE